MVFLLMNSERVFKPNWTDPRGAHSNSRIRSRSVITRSSGGGTAGGRGGSGIHRHARTNVQCQMLQNSKNITGLGPTEVDGNHADFLTI